MIGHNITLAIRNLKKCWIQTLVSIMGLVLGFVCFAFSMVWARYELSYDSFHRGADRMYLLYKGVDLGIPNVYSYDGKQLFISFKIEDLYKYISEIEDASAFRYSGYSLKKEAGDQAVYYEGIGCDKSFIRMFDIRLISGTWDFLEHDSEIALTKEGARKIFGSTDVLGKEIYCGDGKRKVTAIISGWKQNSCFPFYLMYRLNESMRGNFSAYGVFQTCIRLFPDASVDSVEAKLNRIDFDVISDKERIRLEPLMESHNSILKGDASISVSYIRMFAILGLLLVVLALINFFSIQIIRIRMRRREIALRITCGAGLVSLVSLFVTELVVLLGVSVFGSMILAELFQRKFCALTGLQESILCPAFGYFCCLVAVSILIGWGIVFTYCRRIIRKQVIQYQQRRFTFHQICIVWQLIICALVLFVLSVILGQLDYLLRQTDYGFNSKGLLSIHIGMSYQDPHLKKLEESILHELSDKPYVNEVRMLSSLLPKYGGVSSLIDSWTGKKESDQTMFMEEVQEKTEFYKFYGIRLLAGRFFSQNPDSKEIMINETAAQRLGMVNPVGKQIRDNTIVGVIEDFHVMSPTLPNIPIIFKPHDGYSSNPLSIMVRFDEQYKDELKRQIDSLILLEKAQTDVNVHFLSDIYEDYLKSENMLLKILVAISLASVLVSFMGVFAHISMICEHRRKEIAIRKVNGATALMVMFAFLKEYFLLLSVACVVAFPLGTWGMQNWLNQYVDRISLSWWLYAVIFILLWFLILLCIARQVWSVAHENPSEVIKYD